MKYPPTNRHIEMVENTMGIHWDALKDLYDPSTEAMANPAEKERFELVQQLMSTVETQRGPERVRAARQLVRLMQHDALTPEERVVYTNRDFAKKLFDEAERRLNNHESGFEK